MDTIELLAAFGNGVAPDSSAPARPLQRNPHCPPSPAQRQAPILRRRIQVFKASRISMCLHIYIYT